MPDTLCIALAQINPHPGAIRAKVEGIRRAWRTLITNGTAELVA